MKGFLIDENLPPFYRDQFRERIAAFSIQRIGDAAAPPLGTLDPDILCWCEEND